MSDIKKVLRDHQQRLTKIIDEWSNSEREAKDRISQETKSQSNIINENLNKLRHENQQLNTTLHASDDQLNKSLVEITNQFDALDLKSTQMTPQDIRQKEAEI